MIASYILTYTLVPTMAHFLLRNQHITRRAASPAGRRRRAFRPLSARVRGVISSGCGAAIWACCNWRCEHRFWFAGGFLCVALLSLGLAPFLGQDFFPSVDVGRDQDPYARADRHPDRGNDALWPIRSNRRSARSFRRTGVASIVDNIGLPISGINISYGNSGTIGVFDADILVTLDVKGRRRPTLYVKTLREQLPKAFRARLSLSFRPTSSARSSISARRRRSTSRSPAPISTRAAPTPTSSLAKIRHVPGVADPRIQEAVPEPRAQGRFQSRTRRRRRADGRRRRDQHSGDAAGQHPDGADLLAQSRHNGVSYPVSVQTPQYDIDTLGDLKNLPLTAAQSTQLLGGLATFAPEPLNALVSHYDIRNTVNHLRHDPGSRSRRRRRRRPEDHRRFPRRSA